MWEFGFMDQSFHSSSDPFGMLLSVVSVTTDFHYPARALGVETL